MRTTGTQVGGHGATAGVGGMMTNEATNETGNAAKNAMATLTSAALVLALVGVGCGGGRDTQGVTPDRGDAAAGGAGGSRSGGSGGANTGGSAGGFGGFGTGGSAGSLGGGGSAGGDLDAAAQGGQSGGDAGDPGMDARPTLSKTAVPAPWTSEDIGTVGMPGGSGRTRHEFQVRGAGGDIFGMTDSFHFLHIPVTGDVEIVARLTGMERTSGDAKAGIMFRETVAPTSRNVFMLAMPVMTADNGAMMGKGTRLQYRDNRTDTLTGFFDLVSLRPGFPDAPPLWLRLTRKGSLFEGFVSSDGFDWKKDGQISMMLPPEIAAGLAVTSHTNNDASLASFEGVRITALTDPLWAHAELGTLGGTATGSPRRFELSNAGRGIANDEDGVTFVHRVQQHLGDIELTGKVTGLSYAGSKAARIGLMLRGAMGAEARMVAFVLELGPNGQRYRLQRRSQDGGNISTVEDMTPPPAAPDAGVPDAMATDSDGGADGGVAPPVALQPVWLKLVRVGQRFVGFISEDGRRYHAVIDLPSFVVASNAFVGVTLTSGTETGMVSGRIENVTIATPSIALPERPDAGAAGGAADGAAADAGGP
jgi:hypothetical protein